MWLIGSSKTGEVKTPIRKCVEFLEGTITKSPTLIFSTKLNPLLAELVARLLKVIKSDFILSAGISNFSVFLKYSFFKLL